MPILDDFKARFIEFNVAVVDRLIPVYAREYRCFYDVDYDHADCDKSAVLYLLAHLVATDPSVSGDSSSSKNVTSKSVGSVSESYAQGGGSDRDSWLQSTVYGQRFLMLIRNNHYPMFV